MLPSVNDFAVALRALRRPRLRRPVAAVEMPVATGKRTHTYRIASSPVMSRPTINVCMS